MNITFVGLKLDELQVVSTCFHISLRDEKSGPAAH